MRPKSQLNYSAFGWPRLRPLLGTPMSSPGLKAVFRAARVPMKNLFIEERRGIYSMAPYDKQPCPMMMADLSPSYGVRVHFKYASLLECGSGRPPMEYLFCAVTCDLERDEDQAPFKGELPYGILVTDEKERVIARAGRPPTIDTFSTTDDDIAYLRWEDEDPNVHVAFRLSEGRPFLVQYYMKERTK